MDCLPVSLQRQGEAGLVIQWSDGSRTLHAASGLRANCPCATCREKHSPAKPESKPRGLPVLSLSEAKPVTIVHMHPVGNYAYNIAFSDGHDSGIFTFEYLRQQGSTE